MKRRKESMMDKAEKFVLQILNESKAMRCGVIEKKLARHLNLEKQKAHNLLMNTYKHRLKGKIKVMKGSNKGIPFSIWYLKRYENEAEKLFKEVEPQSITDIDLKKYCFLFEELLQKLDSNNFRLNKEFDELKGFPALKVIFGKWFGLERRYKNLLKKEEEFREMIKRLVKKKYGLPIRKRGDIREERACICDNMVTFIEEYYKNRVVKEKINTYIFGLKKRKLVLNTRSIFEWNGNMFKMKFTPKEILEKNILLDRFFVKDKEVKALACDISIWNDLLCFAYTEREFIKEKFGVYDLQQEIIEFERFIFETLNEILKNKELHKIAKYLGQKREEYKRQKNILKKDIEKLYEEAKKQKELEETKWEEIEKLRREIIKESKKLDDTFALDIYPLKRTLEKINLEYSWGFK